MKRTATVVGVSILLAVAVRVTLPPRAVVFAGLDASGLVRGVVHVHTRRSDGGGSLLDVSSAAAKAGLQFVVVTDHGDGTEIEAPVYLNGVLMIDAVEVTTTDGHVLGLGLDPTPYRLGGSGFDVVEDINRMGGFAIAAHVDSANASLRWRAWDTALTGFEWMNGDSEWRDERRWKLLTLLLPYSMRPTETLTQVLDRPDASLARWDKLLASRRLVTLAAADAHARIGGNEEAPRWWQRLSLPIPGYAALFGVFSNSVTGVHLGGDPRTDATAVLDALRLGHSYSTVDGLAGQANLEFSVRSGPNIASGGDTLQVAGPVMVHIQTAAKAKTRIIVFRNGTVAGVTDGPVLDKEFAAEPAVYRAEIERTGAPGSPPVPWVLSNPVFVRREEKSTDRKQALLAVPVPQRVTVTRTLSPDEWAVEHSKLSQGAVDVVRVAGGLDGTLFRYALSGPESEGPFAAAIFRLKGMTKADLIQLRLRSETPMRVSIELRTTERTETGLRWRRSVFVNQQTRSLSIGLDELQPSQLNQTWSLEPAAVDTLLLVVDGVNTPSGTSGRLWIESAALARASAPN
jgi:hypothetical protein